MRLDSQQNSFLCHLATAELLPTMAFRLWAMGLQNSRWAGGDWREGLTVAGFDEAALESFEILVRTVVAARLGCVDVRWPGSPRLGEDEMRLLDCFRVMQRRESGLAIRRLSAWLEPAAARIAFGPACHLIENFLDAGLWFPERDIRTDWEAPREAYARAVSSAIH